MTSTPGSASSGNVSAFRDTYSKTLTAALSRMAATLVSFAKLSSQDTTMTNC